MLWLTKNILHPCSNGKVVTDTVVRCDKKMGTCLSRVVDFCGEIMKGDCRVIYKPLSKARCIKIFAAGFISGLIFTVILLNII